MRLFLYSLLLLLSIGSTSGMHTSISGINRELSKPPKKRCKQYLYFYITNDLKVKRYGYCNTLLPCIIEKPIDKEFTKTIFLTEEDKKAFKEIFKQAKNKHNKVHTLSYVSNEDIFYAFVWYKREERQFCVKIKRVK